jgi:hypothetical protein
VGPVSIDIPVIAAECPSLSSSRKKSSVAVLGSAAVAQTKVPLAWFETKAMSKRLVAQLTSPTPAPKGL